MQDDLIDDDYLPISRKSVLPGRGFFVPDSIDELREEAEAEAALDGEDVIVVADPDADGLACVALVREAYGGAALLGTGPHELVEGLERVVDFAEPNATVYICDLCPDDGSVIGPLEALVEDAAAVHWYDHHQWDDTVAAAVRDTGTTLVVGESEEECTADVALREIDHSFPDRFADLAAATRDHDLWIRDDPRSGDLADYAYWTEPEEYVETVKAHGADLPEEVVEFLADRRVEKDALIDRAIARGELVELGDVTVGVTYGRCSQNEVAEGLREQGADAAVVVKPSGSASIRGTETFERCHLVARRVNGGGHPRAAGCKPDIYGDMLDYAHHWTTRGATTKRVILDAFEAVLAETDPVADAAVEES